ncbi:MAG: hypothetical protein JSV81_06070 [Anaerolineales bacterium]|nr:MAG: hypothetical protein JSV81_06070 [Anaerolineales bacterium]
MTTTLESNASLLRTALKGNSAFSLLSAAALIAAASPLADFLGLGWPLALTVVGFVLAAHAMVLWWGSSQLMIPRWLVWYAIEGDIGWIIATIVVLVVDPWSFTTGGKWLLAAMGDVVAVFAILQYIGLRRVDHPPTK